MFNHSSFFFVKKKALRLPVSEFSFEPFTVELNYQASLLLTREEIGIVCMGQIAVICVFCVLIGLAALWTRLAVSRLPV